MDKVKEAYIKPSMLVVAVGDNLMDVVIGTSKVVETKPGKLTAPRYDDSEPDWDE